MCYTPGTPLASRLPSPISPQPPLFSSLRANSELTPIQLVTRFVHRDGLRSLPHASSTFQCGSDGRLNEAVLKTVRHFAEANKPIAAVCHGPQVLAAAGVMAGKSCSAYPAVGPDVNRAGGKYVEIPLDAAHVDGKLVTTPAWPAHPAWLAKFLEVLGTKIQP